ncbi:hypothetical protein Godav_016890, partial [Gossypium davidsonii]|nr:hypothetical protein [Gossypium davidsonii]
FFSLASHYDGCHDARCDICNTVRYNAVVDAFHPDFEHVKGGLLRVTGSGDYGSPDMVVQKQLQLSESPVSYNSEGGVELLPKLLDGSTVANRMGMMYEYGGEH